MRNISVLLIGDAKDGPVEEEIRIDSLDQAFRLFGGYHYETVTVASGSTGYTLSVTPWANEVLPLREDADGFLVPERLFEFSVSGSVLRWTKPGEQKTITFRVTLEPGPTSLLKGILATHRADARIHAVRLGGTHAEASSGNFTFIARHAGSRYNGATVFVTGGLVTVTPKPGTGRTLTYKVANDAQLALLLKNETARGYQSLLLFGPLSDSALTIPHGTYTLSGGTDGSLTPQTLRDWVDVADLDGVEVICPIGLTTQQLEATDVLDLLSQNLYPTLCVAQAPPSGTALSGVANLSRHLVSVGFQTTYDTGLPKERVDDAAPLVAAIIGDNVHGITAAALPEAPVTTRYDRLLLHTLAASGHTVAYRAIGKDWSLWHAVTGDRKWPVSQFRAYQEIVRAIYEVLLPALGETRVDTDDLQEMLAAALSVVRGSRIVDFALELKGQILYADVWFVPYGEVQVVQAQVVLGTREDVSPV